MKSLKIIQILAKIFYIVSIVIFILAIISVAGSVIAISIFPAIQNIIVAEPNKTLVEYLAEHNIKVFDIYAGLAISIGYSALTIFLSKYTELICKEQIRLGTPFDHGFVKKMRKYAFINIMSCICVNVIVAVVVAVIGFSTKTDVKYDASTLSTVGWGISVLILSLYCEYGANLLHSVASAPAPTPEEEETSAPKSE